MAATFYMKKIDLIEAVSKEIKITRSEAKQSVEIILEEISSAIVSGKGVEVRVFVLGLLCKDIWVAIHSF